MQVILLPVPFWFFFSPTKIHEPNWMNLPQAFNYITLFSDFSQVKHHSELPRFSTSFKTFKTLLYNFSQFFPVFQIFQNFQKNFFKFVEMLCIQGKWGNTYNGLIDWLNTLDYGLIDWINNLLINWFHG